MLVSEGPATDSVGVHCVYEAVCMRGSEGIRPQGRGQITLADLELDLEPPGSSLGI